MNRFRRKFDEVYHRYVAQQEKLNVLRAQAADAFKERFLFEKKSKLKEEQPEPLDENLSRLKVLELSLKEAVEEAEYYSNQLYIEMTIASCFIQHDQKSKVLREIANAKERAEDCVKRAEKAPDDLARRRAVQLRELNEQALSELRHLLEDL